MPTRSKITILKQVVSHIPAYVVNTLARKHGVTDKCRTFSPWSHVVSMFFAQLSHALSLNDVCDSLRNHRGSLATVRGATPPSRNGLSYANRVRNADMAEELFWAVLGKLRSQHPHFGAGRKYAGFPRRFKRMINVVDSTTIKLVATCLDWAKHRRRKAAAKCHMRLDLQTFLPRFALVKGAKTHDSQEAVQLCAGVRSGEIVVFDKAYVDFAHLFQLNQRFVFWVTRAKDNMAYRVVKRLSTPTKTTLQDSLIRLTVDKSSKDYPAPLRLVRAKVQVDAKNIEFTFVTNNIEWSARSIGDRYKSRWGIEVFFKQLKQTLQLADLDRTADLFDFTLYILSGALEGNIFSVIHDNPGGSLE